VNGSGADQGGRAGIPDGHPRTPSIGFHIAFTVEDGETAAEHIAAAGLEIIDGPRRRPDGFHQFYLYDPDGHLIEICSHPVS
jgi:catechol 2,3-dioxygenase-like lactoylglutathione lyase family enzyme